MLDEVELNLFDENEQVEALKAEISVLAKKYFIPDHNILINTSIPVSIKSITKDEKAQMVIARLHKAGLKLLAESRKYKALYEPRNKLK